MSRIILQQFNLCVVYSIFISLFTILSTLISENFFWPFPFIIWRIVGFQLLYELFRKNLENWHFPRGIRNMSGVPRSRMVMDVQNIYFRYCFHKSWSLICRTNGLYSIVELATSARVFGTCPVWPGQSRMVVELSYNHFHSLYDKSWRLRCRTNGSDNIVGMTTSPRTSGTYLAQVNGLSCPKRSLTLICIWLYILIVFYV